MKVAIITGASSGMGREFARIAAASGEVDEIWAVARRSERLAELAAELSIPLRPLCLDLGDASSAERLEAMLGEEKPDVRALVNAAGFAKFGTCSDITRAENDGMIDVNVRALVDVTTACLPYMTRGARIIEIASCAGFLPLPGLNVYAASKAFVLRYTRGLKRELMGRGLRVTALCPGWVKTEFVAVARDTKNGKTVKHYYLAATPRFIASYAWRANALGLAVVSCPPHIIGLRLFCKISPDWLSMTLWKLFTI
jgi:short-subunit dehydrogenase